MNENQIDFHELEKFTHNLKKIAFIVKRYGLISETFITESIKDICGYSVDEVEKLPENIYSLIHTEDNEKIKKELIEFETNPERNNAEFVYRIIDKNENIIWIKDFISLTRKDGKITCRKSILLNINEIKKHEEELIKENEKLVDLNVQKDKFISIISHDLRSPFTTLLGFSEIMLNETDLTEEERTEYLKYIYDASKTQLNLINCLLDWSRLQTGRIKVEPVRLNVKFAVSNAIAPLTGDAVRKNIDVKMDIPAELAINADERLFGQAIVHLVSNAIKFTPEGKEVNITASRFKEGLIEIIVRDEGMGIAEENHSKLFRIDQKFSLQGTNGEKGSGFGLTLVKEIIDKHGGQVWFYSNIGEGSEFHITLPEAKNLILLVEDDEATKNLYKKYIESSLTNFEVVFANNGYEAINIYKQILPTVVITDHDMPLMNGIQLVEILQKRESNKTVPIIVISAKLNDEVTKKYSRLGVEKIIPKPVDQNLLITSIKECLY